MAYQEKGIQDKILIADNLEDLKNLPHCDMGSTCYIIETGETYIVNSQGDWKLKK